MHIANAAPVPSSLSLCAALRLCFKTRTSDGCLKYFDCHTIALTELECIFSSFSTAIMSFLWNFHTASIGISPIGTVIMVAIGLKKYQAL